MDRVFYNKMLQGAADILQQHIADVGREFAEGFMISHNPDTGPKVQGLTNYLITQMRRLNGRDTFVSDQQFYDVMFNYIKEVFNAWKIDMQRQQGGGFGMTGGNPGYGFSGGTPSIGRSTAHLSGGSLGGGLSGSTPSINGVRDIDAVRAEQARAAAAPPPVAAASFTAPSATQGFGMTSYVDHPLDKFQGKPVNLSKASEQLNWLGNTTTDRSIMLMRRWAHTAPEMPYIQMGQALARVYYDNELDVIKNIFKVVPKEFTSGLFCLEVFYNHITVLDMPTKDFASARDALTHAIREHNPKFDDTLNVYAVVMDVMNQMYKGPAKVFSAYLLEAVNRALWGSFGIKQSPKSRITFDDLEDLEVVLTTFKHPIMDAPNAPTILKETVNVALYNAILGFSEVMFTDPEFPLLDEMKASPAFPYSMAGVYADKAMIPESSSPLAATFTELMHQTYLKQKTVIRSIRSVVLTNILGQTLRTVQDTPTPIEPGVTDLLRKFAITYSSDAFSDTSVTYMYNNSIKPAVNQEKAWDSYVEDPEEYSTKESEQVSQLKEPSIPVDRTLFAIQYKVDPSQYLAAFKVCSVFDADEHSQPLQLSKAHIDNLHLTQ